MSIAPTVAPASSLTSGIQSRPDPSPSGLSRPTSRPVESSTQVVEAAARRLQEVKSSSWGWDGRFARPVTPAAMGQAIRLLAGLWSGVAEKPGGPQRRDIFLRPQVFALPTGGVQFEWHADSIDLEVAVEADGSAVITTFAADLDIDCDVEVDAHWPGRPPQPAVAALATMTERVWLARPLAG
jgi:hypothetical protein